MTPSAGPNKRPIVLDLFTPVDASYLAFFRIYFGAMMLCTVAEYFLTGQIATDYIDPPFHFSFHGFDWLSPLPGDAMYIVFAIIGVCALFLLAGLLYRLAALLLWIGFTYVFLLEKAVYQNHYYLISLICFLLIFLPAHRCWSLDARLCPAHSTNAVPAWTLWLLRFQIGLPYVLGGIAKLKADWLLGQPMQMWLSVSVWRVMLGPIAEEPWFALLFSWGGLLFDLTIVPLLIWNRTRIVAYGACVAFHLMNAFMFDIGIFPWLMIGATTVFFSPAWPRLAFAYLFSQAVNLPMLAISPMSTRTRTWIVGLCAAYAVVQLVVPFRHWLFPGNLQWTEEGYLFSWNMMLSAKVSKVSFNVTDRETGKSLPVDIVRSLTRMQQERLGQDPEMMREFAQFLRECHAKKGRDVEVYVFCLCSLNGRKPQLLIDPRVDLSREPRSWRHQYYIVPLREPFRLTAWNVPINEWEP